MPPSLFIVRDALIDQQQNVLGYALRFSDEPEPPANLVNCVASIHSINQHSTTKTAFIMPVTPDQLELPAGLPQEQTILSLAADALDDEQTFAAAKAIRHNGYGLYVRGADALPPGAPVLSVASHVETGFDKKELPDNARRLTHSVSPLTRVVVSGVSNWDEFERCATLDDEVSVLAGRLGTAQRPSKEDAELATNQRLIIRLMHLTQQNAGVGEIEAQFRRDPALTYTLLKFLSSVEYKRATPVTTIRQAIAVMGYKPLYRWLSVLLGMSIEVCYSAFLIETGLIRARFCELLGAGLPESDEENLFTVGMLSAFELLLGMPMANVLKEMAMTPDIRDAILFHQGPYGPYLGLALACETDGDAAALASQLGLDTKTVNRAHLEAIAWTKTLDI